MLSTSQSTTPLLICVSAIAAILNTINTNSSFAVQEDEPSLEDNYSTEDVHTEHKMNLLFFRLCALHHGSPTDPP